jgi:hypothetical protein
MLRVENMSKPKLRTNTVATISVQDWNAFVIEVYGRPYNFQQQDGCRMRGQFRLSVYNEYDPDWDNGYDNDTIPEDVNTEEMCVSLKGWLARDPKQPLPNQEYDYWLSTWWERNFYPNIEILAQDLCHRGLLAPGKYLILI